MGRVFKNAAKRDTPALRTNAIPSHFSNFGPTQFLSVEIKYVGKKIKDAESHDPARKLRKIYVHSFPTYIRHLLSYTWCHTCLWLALEPRTNTQTHTQTELSITVQPGQWPGLEKMPQSMILQALRTNAIPQNVHVWGKKFMMQNLMIQQEM